MHILRKQSGGTFLAYLNEALCPKFRHDGGVMDNFSLHKTDMRA